jgi:hypothetical protein
LILPLNLSCEFGQSGPAHRGGRASEEGFDLMIVYFSAFLTQPTICLVMEVLPKISWKSLRISRLGGDLRQQHHPKTGAHGVPREADLAAASRVLQGPDTIQPLYLRDLAGTDRNRLFVRPLNLAYWRV